MTLKTKPSEIHIIIPVWGKKYVTFFLKYSLLSQLTQDNLPFISKRIKIIYKIYSSTDFISTIQKHPNLAELKKFCSVNYVDINKNNISKLPWDVQVSACYKDALTDLYKKNAAFMPLCPDIIFCNDFYQDLYTYIEKNKKVLLRFGYNSVIEPAVRQISKSPNTDWLDKKQFSKLIFECTHPIRAKSISKKLLDDWSSVTYWKIDQHNFFVQCCHQHPVYIWPQKKVMEINGTIDNSSFIYDVCPNLKDHYIFKGNEGLLIECSEFLHPKFNNRPMRKQSIWTFINFVFKTTSSKHVKQQFLFKKILFSEKKPSLIKLIKSNLRFFIFNLQLLSLLNSPEWVKRSLASKLMPNKTINSSQLIS